MECDVAIAGGGPAGCATALSLRAHAPSLRVVLVEASGYDSVRIGETLPPLARPLLEHLGVWEAFCAQGHREVFGTAAAWGGATPLPNDFLFATAGNGWHLDRNAFDRMLATEAERRGVRLSLHTRWEESRRAARFVVDATGTAQLARRRGARFVAVDRLVGFTRFFASDLCADPRTLVEAFADGWWYTAGLPDGGRVAACLTDAPLARRMRLADAGEWNGRLAAMPVIGAMLRGACPRGPVVVRPAQSRHLAPVAGDDWLAVGDAAAGFDPLSSQGIAKALRSGIFASYAIGDLLTRGDDTGLRRYRRFVRAELASYLAARAKHYRAEGRWAGKEFWESRGAPLEELHLSGG
jgi:flavin-dependent dehydrogenase